ncbi:DUF2500 domain-containing protein [Clostridium sp. CS001]|uniref:DUF2500 domain-containing protein n=1 Tax=Clostridium sp. CS001 TaxID=2880648 RepID=UPI001CF57266|nr:DUF2500 domain-containing protein [Clostridium sp. CS001]MCB2289902.1 DUF2500 domain-containing protein [Clostridium sp. CS001]
MFNIIQYLFPIMFFLVFGIIIFTVIKGIGEWSNNNRQPVLSVDAKIVSKRVNVSNSSNMNNGQHHHTSSTSYYVTFEVESGDRMELQTRGDEYGLLAEGDSGKLVFQGTRYKSFQRKVSNTY